MRSKFPSVFLSGIAGLLLITTPVFSGEPIRFEPEAVDFGQVKQGEPVEIEFSLHNPGKEVQTIQFMDFSVPGLFAQVNPRIEAGGNAKVLVRWNTENLSGHVSGEVTLMFDLKGDSVVVMPVSGHVVPVETAQPDR